MTEKVVYLDIQSWVGRVINASHFYGTLKQSWGTYGEREESEVQLRRTLTEAQAKSINALYRRNYDAEMYNFYKVHPGDSVTLFDDKDTLVEAAKVAWKELFPDAVRLQDRYTDTVYDTKEEGNP